jgi:hypothetical protein
VSAPDDIGVPYPSGIDVAGLAYLILSALMLLAYQTLATVGDVPHRYPGSAPLGFGIGIVIIVKATRPCDSHRVTG